MMSALPPLPRPPPSPLAQSTRYTDAACVALDTHAMRAVADAIFTPSEKLAFLLAKQCY